MDAVRGRGRRRGRSGRAAVPGVLRHVASETQDVFDAGRAKSLYLVGNPFTGCGDACEVGEGWHAACLHERSNLNRVRLCIAGSAVCD